MRSGLVLASVAALACDGPGDAPDPASRDAAPGPPAARAAAGVPADRAGTLELHGVKHSFLVVRCDLAGRSADRMLLRGTGIAPDGRPFAVEVERLRGGGEVNERATVFFGGIVDGDRWTARRIGRPDGRWFPGEGGEAQVEGPLVRVGGNELVVVAEFEHEREGGSRSGAIRAACPE